MLLLLRFGTKSSFQIFVPFSTLSGMCLKRGQSCTDKVKIFRQRFLSVGFAAEIVSVRRLLSLKRIDGCSADCTGIRHSCFLLDSV